MNLLAIPGLACKDVGVMSDMEYTIIEATSPLSLCRLVKSFIEEGWQPQGGICIGSCGVYVQAMIRNKTPWPLLTPTHLPTQTGHDTSQGKGEGGGL